MGNMGIREHTMVCGTLDTDVPNIYVPEDLFSLVPMFPSTNIPFYPCSLVPIFPGTYFLSGLIMKVMNDAWPSYKMSFKINKKILI